MEEDGGRWDVLDEIDDEDQADSSLRSSEFLSNARREAAVGCLICQLDEMDDE
ncbi:MAG: hypothetical protein ABI823_03935 [Bryobacteraceae bacterium]